MDWITGMQKAIDYIEEHITEKIDYESVAKQSFSSCSHFQSVFSILCGYTLGEYIRNRRLSLAGSELTSGSTKVIDVALKYGYDSSDSFSEIPRYNSVAGAQQRTNAKILFKTVI